MIYYHYLKLLVTIIGSLISYLLMIKDYVNTITMTLHQLLSYSYAIGVSILMLYAAISLKKHLLTDV